jgi:hypothetical protein
MPCAIAQFIGVRLRPYPLELSTKQFAAVQARPLVTIGVAKGVAKGLSLHTVQKVSFDALTRINSEAIQVVVARSAVLV